MVKQRPLFYWLQFNRCVDRSKIKPFAVREKNETCINQLGESEIFTGEMAKSLD